MKRMMRKLSILALLGLAASVSFVARSHPLSADTAGVTISAPPDVAAGSSFTVDVDVTDLTGFDAGQFDVSFDEAVIQLDATADGTIGTTPIPVDVWNKIGPGTYRVVVNVPGVPGVDGHGRLATLSFRAVGEPGATSSIDLANGFLGNNRAEEIPATWAGDSTALATADGETHTKPSTDWRFFLLAVPLGAVVVLSAAWLGLREIRGFKSRG